MHRTGRLLGGGLLLLFFCASFAHAQQTLYNFGTMQEGQNFVAAPGENVSMSLYFFMDETYGNRITHISARVEQSPPGWVVELDPPVGKVLLNVSGILTNSSENLYVSPKPVLPQMPETPEEGVYYLKSPSGKGYLQATRMLIRVRVPKDATLGQTYNVKVGADGFWFGQAGNVALRQSRAFNYAITVANKEYTEKVLTPEEIEALSGKKKPAPAEAAPLDMNQILVYVLGAAVVLLVIYNIAVTRKKK